MSVLSAEQDELVSRTLLKASAPELYAKSNVDRCQKTPSLLWRSVSGHTAPLKKAEKLADIFANPNLEHPMMQCLYWKIQLICPT